MKKWTEAECVNYYQEKRFSLEDVFDIYDKLEKQEKAWCAAFCAENSGAANEQRELFRDHIISGLFRFKVELEMLNDRRRRTA